MVATASGIFSIATLALTFALSLLSPLRQSEFRMGAVVAALFHPGFWMIDGDEEGSSHISLLVFYTLAVFSLLLISLQHAKRLKLDEAAAASRNRTIRWFLSCVILAVAFTIPLLMASQAPPRWASDARRLQERILVFGALSAVALLWFGARALLQARRARTELLVCVVLIAGGLASLPWTFLCAYAARVRHF